MTKQERKRIQSLVLEAARSEGLAHGEVLTDRSRYSLVHHRTVVDADVDYVEWGWRWFVHWIRPTGRLLELGYFDSRADAQAYIDARCSTDLSSLREAA